MNTAPLRSNEPVATATAASKEPFQPTGRPRRQRQQSSRGGDFFQQPSGRGRGRGNRRGGRSPPLRVNDYANDKDYSFFRTAAPPVTGEESPKPFAAQNNNRNNMEVPPGVSWRRSLSEYASRRRDAGNGGSRQNHHSGREPSRRPNNTTGRSTNRVPSSGRGGGGRHAPSRNTGGRRAASPPPRRHADTSGASTQRPPRVWMPRIGIIKPSKSSKIQKPALWQDPGVPTFIFWNAASTVSVVSQMTNMSEDDDHDDIKASLPRTVWTVWKHSGASDDQKVKEDDNCSALTDSVATLESHHIGSDYSPVTVGDDDCF